MFVLLSLADERWLWFDSSTGLLGGMFLHAHQLVLSSARFGSDLRICSFHKRSFWGKLL